MSKAYTLYGSFASYYTAKSRSYFVKKGIPFIEKLPSAAEFRTDIRPVSGSHRIPQMLTPNGDVVQDSVEMLDYCEARHSELPAIPTTVVQRCFVHLMELMGSEGLLRLAWLHRWIYPGNNEFVLKDFGRSFKPKGDDEELKHYGNLIADRMRSYGVPEATAEYQEELENQFTAMLALFEAHFQYHPYILGGHPSAADYSVMGALFAHMGRDPVGRNTMQNQATRVFRWVEHMNVPQLQSPEFIDYPVEYPADDQVPATALAILNGIAETYGKPMLASVKAFNDLAKQQNFSSGYEFDQTKDQPMVPAAAGSSEAKNGVSTINVHHVWLAQRSQLFYQGLAADEQLKIANTLGAGTCLDILKTPVYCKLTRNNNRMVIA